MHRDVFVTAEGDDGDFLHSILGMQPVLFLFFKLFLVYSSTARV